MRTRITINSAKGLPDGSVMIAGSVEGPFLSLANRGLHGVVAAIDGSEAKVLLIGVAVVDPAFLSTERQGILVSVVEGDPCSIAEGATLEFSEVNV